MFFSFVSQFYQKLIVISCSYLFRVYCSDCNCEDCFNTPNNENLVEEARRHALDRDPLIFESKVNSSDVTLIKKGCKCTKTNCLKVSNLKLN